MYAAENNIEYKGCKLSLKDIGLLFDIKLSTIHRLYK